MAKKIEVTLTLNTRQFKRALASANRSMKTFNSSTTASAGAASKLGASLLPLTIGAAGLGVLSGQIGSVGKGSNDLRKAFTGLSDSITFTSNSSGGLREQIKDANHRMNQMAHGTEPVISRFQKLRTTIGTGARGLVGGFGALIGSMARMLFSVGTLLAGVAALAGGFALLRSSLGTASEFQDVELVLGNIFGSAENGAIALKELTLLAEKLPFAFKDLAGASPILATVSGDLQELKDNMMLAANIAATFKIPFDLAASGLQRAFSAGAGAADIFRERGVLAAAGFQAGVSVSIDETKAKLKEFGKTLDENAEKLNNTFSGAVSQAGDAITLFNREVGNEALPFFQSLLVEITNNFRENKTSADAFAKTIGNNLVNSFQVVAIGGAYLLDVLIGIKDAFIFLITLGGRFDTIGAIGDVLKSVGIDLQNFAEGMGMAFEKSDAVKKFFADVKVGAVEFKEEIEKNTKAAKEFKKPLTEIKNVMTGGTGSLESGIGVVKTALQIFREELSTSKGTLQEYKALMLKLTELYNTDEIGLTEFLRLQRELDETFGQNEGLNSFIDTLGSAQKTLSEDLATAFLEGQSAGDAFKGFMKTMVTQIIADIMRLMIIQPILQALMGAFGMPGTFGVGGNFSLTPKAMGGSVMGNKPYVVGERGPELFVPGRSGTIIPNGAGGGTAVTYNINAVDSQSFQMALAKDPSFVFAVTEAGRRKQPGRI